MDHLILMLGLLMLAGFVAMTWIGPRRYGAVGLIVVHFVVLFSYFVFAGVSLSVGVYEYDGALSIVGLLLQVFILDCLLLPLGLIALWIRRRAGHHLDQT